MSNIFAPTDSNEDVLDSRDLVERQQEIEEELTPEDAEFYETFSSPDDFAEHIRNHPDGDDDLAAEYMTLYDFNEEGQSTFGAAEWDLGVTLVNDSHFEDYARQLADDVGAVRHAGFWPNQFIDWSAAAEALQVDYTSIEYDGTTFWGRA